MKNSFVFGLALILAALPLLAKKLKLDPALMAAPLITTIVDVCSLLILVLCAHLAF